MGNLDSLQHICRQGRRCKARIRNDDGVVRGAGVERPDTLCRSCEEHAFDAIRQLASDYGQLLESRTEQRSPVSGPWVSGSTDLPIPISLAVDTLMTAIDEESARWARRLPGDGPELTVICSQLGTLVGLPPTSVTVWVPHPDGGDDLGDTVLDGVDAVLRLAALHHRAVKVLGLEPDRDEKLSEPCHVCGWATVTASVRTELVTCHRCHNVWHQDEFARLNNPLAAA